MLESLALCALVIAWLVPNHYAPWASAYNEAAASACVFLLISAKARRFGGTRSAAAWVLFAVVLIPVTQWLVGKLVYSGDAWVSSLYLLLFGLSILIGQVLALDDGGWTMRLAVAMLAGAVISAFLIILQALGFMGLGLWYLDTPLGYRPYANLMQPNNAATLLGMGVVSLMLIYEKGRLSALTCVLIFLVLCLGLMGTASRTSLIFGPIILAALVGFRSRGVPIRMPLMGVLLGASLQWALAFQWVHIQEMLFLSSPVEGLASRNIETGRLQMWPLLLAGLEKSPISGYGWLQVGADELAAVNEFPAVNELWLHAHNLFLDLIIWCGYPIGAIMVLVVVYWFMSRFRAVEGIETAYAWVLIAVFGVHSLLELPYHYLYFLIPVGLWIGRIESVLNSKRQHPVLNWIPVLTATFIFVGIAKDYVTLEDRFRIIRFESLRIGGSMVRRAEVPDAPFLSSLTSYLNFVRIEPSAGMSEAQLRAMENSADRYPYAASLARLGTALALNGREAEAHERFVAIRQMFGQLTYDEARRSLRGRIDNGTPQALVKLERSLPD